MKTLKIVGALLCMGGMAGSCGLYSSNGGKDAILGLASLAFVGFILFVVGRFGDSG